MRRRRAQLKRLARDIAIQRARYLYRLAVEAARRGDWDYASLLGQRAKLVAMRTGVRLPRRIKRALCKHCGLPLIPGVTARVRLRSQGRFSYVVVTCNKCGWIHRYPYKKGPGGGGGERPGEGEEGAPREPRRDNREEGRDGASTQGDRREAPQEGGSQGENPEERGRGRGER